MLRIYNWLKLGSYLNISIIVPFSAGPGREKSKNSPPFAPGGKA